MAESLRTEDERNERVLLVGELFKETGLSTRKLANYITTHYFSISNYTVSDYLKRYVKLRPEEVKNIKEKIDNNTDWDVNNDEIRKRVEDNAELFEQGYTIEEIAKATDISYWTVYRDITRRIKKIDPDRYEEKIKPKLTADSLENIQKK